MNCNYVHVQMRDSFHGSSCKRARPPHKYYVGTGESLGREAVAN